MADWKDCSKQSGRNGTVIDGGTEGSRDGLERMHPVEGRE